MKKKRRLNAKGRRKRRRRIIKRIIRLLILMIPIAMVCMIGSCVRNRTKEKTEDKKTDKVEEITTVSLLSCGDIIVHEPFLKSSHYLQEDGTYQYDSLFKYVKEFYQSSDYTVVNFEGTIAKDEFSSFPLFRAPSDILTALSANGVDLCLLANNHIYDNSSEGLLMTQEAMENNALLYAGVYKSDSEEHYKIIDIQGIKIGVFNYTTETGDDDSGTPTINSLPLNTNDQSLIDSFDYNDLESLYNEIQTGLNAMDSQGVDYTIAYMHWGTEYQLNENDLQNEIAQKLCDHGIDALIGGHPHVIQPIDILESTSDEHKMLCVYSMGNHISNQYKGRIESVPEGHTEDGIMVELVLEKNKDDLTSLKDVKIIPTWTYRTPDVTDEQNPEYYIIPLSDPEDIITKVNETDSLDIRTNVQQSLERTNGIIGDGLDRINEILPISIK